MRRPFVPIETLWPEQDPLSSPGPTTPLPLASVAQHCANARLRQPIPCCGRLSARGSNFMHRAVRATTTLSLFAPPPVNQSRRRRTFVSTTTYQDTRESTGVGSRRKVFRLALKKLISDSTIWLFPNSDRTLAACCKTKSPCTPPCRLVLLHRHSARGPGHALVACSSTWRAADVLSRPGPGAPLFVYSRMPGRPRGVACYCGAYPFTAAQPSDSLCPSGLVKCHSTVCARFHLDRQPAAPSGCASSQRHRCSRMSRAHWPV